MGMSKSEFWILSDEKSGFFMSFFDAYLIGFAYGLAHRAII